MIVPAHAGGQLGLADERRPVGGVERVVVLEPLVAAERAARQLELEDVVEDAPRGEELRAAVALEVVRRAETGRELLAERELEPELRDVFSRRVSGDALVLGSQANLERQPILDRPRILDEQADEVRVNVALGNEALPGCNRVAADRVVAILAAGHGHTDERAASQKTETRAAASPLNTLLPMRSTCTPNLSWCWPPKLA